MRVDGELANRHRALDELYELIGELRTVIGGPRMLADCHVRMGSPRHGVHLVLD